MNAPMPLYWGDLLGDTTHLGRCDLGSYMLLIGWYWCQSKPLPDDDDALMMIAKCPKSHWDRCKPTLAAFFQVGNGVWRHKRVDAELAKLGPKPPQSERNRGSMNGANTFILGNELERLLKRKSAIKSQYADHQTWDAKDKAEYASLRKRELELRRVLGVQV